MSVEGEQQELSVEERIQAFIDRDEPAEVEAPEQDAPTESGTSEQANEQLDETTDVESDFDHGIKLEDIADEQARAYAARVEKEMKATLTRATQKAAVARQEAADAMEWISALDSEETRQQAFAELANRYGIELDFSEEETPAEYEEGTFAWEDDQPQADPRIEQLVEAETQRQEREASMQAEQQQHEFFQGLQSRLDVVAEDWGLEELPENATRQILSLALSMDRDEQGFPDVRTAAAQVEAWQAAERETAIKEYLASKKSPPADLHGSSGVPQPDLSSEASRLAAANAIAGRHY